jgi:GTP:adenosylcobinamide-phosphate guanylyltransferase
LRFVEARETPSASVAHAMQVLPPCVPLLVTTADHPLLTPAMVESFCVEALRAQADVVAAVVPGDLVRKAFPNSERTFLHFRDGSYCGANLFTFVTREGQRAAEAWLQVERHRKRPWKMIRALGIGVLVRFLLRRISLAETAERLSSRLGIRAVAVVLSHAEAAVDVDTESDLALVEQVLRARRAQGGSLAES